MKQLKTQNFQNKLRNKFLKSGVKKVKKKKKKKKKKTNPSWAITKKTKTLSPLNNS